MFEGYIAQQIKMKRLSIWKINVESVLKDVAREMYEVQLI